MGTHTELAVSWKLRTAGSVARSKSRLVISLTGVCVCVFVCMYKCVLVCACVCVSSPAFAICVYAHGALLVFYSPSRTRAVCLVPR